jgi:hypothetical protein
MNQRLKNILHIRFLPHVFAGLVILMLLVSPVILIDYALLLFLSISFILIIEYKDKADYLLENSNLYFTSYFVSRTCLALFCIVYFSSPNSGSSKIIEMPLIMVDSSLLLISIFLFMLIFYWQIISKGLVRYGEVIARFYLDALPGQQAGIEQEKRDGLLSSIDARKKRNTVLLKSIELGSLDAGLRLAIGNLFLLVTLTGLFLFSTSVSYIHLGQDIWNTDSLMLIVSKTASFGVLLFLDAILFIIPFSLSLNTISENEKRVYKKEVSFNSMRGTIIVVLIAMVSMQFIAGSAPWEACGVLIITFIFLRYYILRESTFMSSSVWKYEEQSGTIEKVPYSLISANSTLVEISSDLLCSQSKFNSVSPSVWIQLFLEAFNADAGGSSYLNIYVSIINEESNAIRITYPNNEQELFIIPKNRILLDMPISTSSLVCSDVITSCREVFPYHSWVLENEYEEIRRNSFFGNKEKSLMWILKEIIITSSRRARREALTIELLLASLHGSNIGRNDGMKFIELATEIGYQRILDASNIIEKYGYDGYDLNGILNALILSEDDTPSSLLKHYFNYLTVNSQSQIESTDGKVRAIMISDKTSSSLNEFDLSFEEVDFCSYDYLGQIFDSISSILSVLRERGSGPLLVLIPDISLSWIDDFVAQARLKNYPTMILERSSFPSGLQFYPIARL